MSLILDGTNGLSDVDGSAATPAIRGSDANTGVFFGTDIVGLSTGGSERVRVDASGNLLVGTATTSTLSGYTVVGQFKNSIGIVSASANEFSGALLRESSGSNSISLNADPGNLRAGSFLGFGVDGSERLRITDAGNVGIGTRSPVTVLQIGGNETYTGESSASNNVATFKKSGGQAGIRVIAQAYDSASEANLDLANFASKNLGVRSGFRLSGGIGSGAGASNEYLAFSSIALNSNSTITATEHARINSSGNLLMGTTSSFTGTSNYKQEILGSTGGGTAYKVVNNSDWAVAFFNASGTQVGRIEVGVSSTLYSTSSDYRLKEAVAPMTGALARVAALKPCTYTWKSTGEQSQGFIAHELQAVVPDAVTGEKDAVNEDGSIKPQGIDTSFLVATLTAAIQELNAKVDAQAAEIAALKGQA
jgi:hypothetical protein